MAEDDWGLQAVVRGCAGTAATTNMSSSSAPPLHLQESRGVASIEDDLLFCCFPDLFSAPSELEDLYKPFFPNQQQQKQKQQLPMLSPLPFSTTTTSTSSLSRIGGVKSSHLQKQQSKPLLPLQNPRSKRRKCQQQRVVCQVPADGLPSDLWAWRKYGQKPIKGSPFPRGYYRCSSSKGCMARKQVERSKTDPNALVITYTGEHSHPPPTHRNSLAGSTRYSLPTSSSAAAQEVSSASPDPCSSTSPPTTSPKEKNDELEAEGLLAELLGEEDMVVTGLETETNRGHDPLRSAEALSPFLWMANSGSAASGGSSRRALAQS